MSLKYVKLTSSILNSDPSFMDEVTQAFYDKIIYGNVPVAPVQPLDTRCWIWSGAKDRDYSKFTLSKTSHGNVYVRRGQIVSYIIHKGPTNGLMVLHLCQEKLCVRPDHLVLGNASLNGIHATLNRHNVPLFNKAWKLTTKQVIQIRKLHFQYKLKPSEISPMFNVTDATISNILTGKTYSHVR